MSRRAARALLPLLLLRGWLASGLEAAKGHPGSAGDPGLGFKVHLFAPAGDATLPVIFFVSGFAGDAPVSTYSDLLTEIADRGFVVVGLDRLGVPDYPRQARDFLRVLDWARGGALRAALRAQGLAAVPDVEGRSCVMGHSEGNHVVGQALNYDCSVAKAWVMIDPVDGYDPYRFVKSQDLIKPGQRLNFTIPALILDNALDTRPTVPIFPACDPYEMGTSRFYPAMRGPVWNVNASDYGHVDCLNQAFDRDWVCASDPASDKAAYRAHLADTTALFFRSLLAGQQANLQLLADYGTFKVNVTLKQDLKGLAPGAVRAGCEGGPPAGSVPALLV